MGLLDGNLDPQSMQTLALAGGLLSPGSFGQGLSRGIAGSQDALLRQQQIESTKQEAAMRELNMRRAMMQLQEASLWSQPGGAMPGPSPAASALGQGAATGSLGPTNANAALMASPPAQNAPPSGLPPGIAGYKGMPLEQLRSRINIGLEPKEAVELWKAANVGTPMAPGWRVVGNGPAQYLPDPNAGGATMDSPNSPIRMIPGGAEAKGTIAGATEAGTLDARNARTLLPLDWHDRMPGLAPGVTLGDFISPPAGVAARAPNTVTAANLSADARRTGVSSPGLSGFTPTGQPQPTGAHKTAADIEAEKLQATQGVHAATDPLVKFNTDRLVNAHAENQATFTKLNDTVREEAELQNRNNQIAPMLGKISTGGFAPEQRIALANSLQTAGWVPDALKGKFSEWVANGDPTTGKVIENQLASAGIKTMLDTLDKEGKPNRAIFQEIQKAQESVKSGNATLKQVFALQKQLYDWHYSQQQQMASAMASPDYNPVTLPAQLSKARNDSIQPGKDLPADFSAKNLVKGTTYRLPNGTVGTWDGFKFKGQ